MNEIKLFRISGQTAAEISPNPIGLEKSVQNLIEANLEPLLGVTFLRSEFPTGRNHRGRVDTLGIDENGCPVIIEYKREINVNVITQGLYYLDWLLDHKADFALLAQQVLGATGAERVDWSAPRLICIAPDFTKYDEHAVKQIDRNIDLMRYRQFGSDLLVLELVYSTSASSAAPLGDKALPQGARKAGDKPVSQALIEMDPPMRELHEALREYLVNLGDDVQEKQLKLYVAYRRIRNFACVEVQKSRLLVHVRLNPDEVQVEPDFTRDMRTTGHWGTGDLEITIRTVDDLRKAQPLLQRSYEAA